MDESTRVVTYTAGKDLEVRFEVEPTQEWRNVGAHEVLGQIQKAVAALAELDDGTLRDLGIPDRSHIESTVRYCHDC